LCEADLSHPRLPSLRRRPQLFPDTPTSFRRRPPWLGEHTDEVLAEAGFATGEIETLRAAAAVR
jgi:crotonobetainyl-CoA:carnitine CoA-transferase CaiB-like acyl-CoA transferase